MMVTPTNNPSRRHQTCSPLPNNRRSIGDRAKERVARTEELIEDLAVGNEVTETVTGGGKRKSGLDNIQKILDINQGMNIPPL